MSNLRLRQLWVCMLVLLFTISAEAARLKDIAFVQGVRDNQLLGYGLVVGLAGSGDFGDAQFTLQATASMLGRMGIRVEDADIQTQNVAAVMVTADLPPFARSGQRIDVNVSSLGNARSLQGGTLLMTPLMGPDGQTYAVAQGQLSLGGFDVSGQRGNSRSTTHPNSGRIPNGALVEQEVQLDLNGRESLRIVLRNPDFTTAVRAAEAISSFFDPSYASTAAAPGIGVASAVDASTVLVEVPEAFRTHMPQFIASVENLDVQRDSIARVIVNERTGTVVLGGQVSLAQVAVAHGSLSVEVSTRFNTSQPRPFGEGDTRVVGQEEIQVNEESATLQLVGPTGSIQDVVAALNALGASPRDLIAILQAIDAAGALHGELVIQ